MERNHDLNFHRPSGGDVLPSLGSGGQRALAHGSNGNLQQMTIFYDGQVRVCSVTENQARTILGMAKQEMDQNKTTTVSSFHQSPLPNPGLSMKQSLQRFLQKRKVRTKEASPTD